MSLEVSVMRAISRLMTALSGALRRQTTVQCAPADQHQTKPTQPSARGLEQTHTAFLGA